MPRRNHMHQKAAVSSIEEGKRANMVRDKLYIDGQLYRHAASS